MKTSIRFRVNGKPTNLQTDDDRQLLWVLRTDSNLTGTKYGCGAGSVRRLHRDGRRQGGPLVQDTAEGGAGQGGRHDRGPRPGRKAPPAAAGLHGPRRVPVRLLHARNDHERLRAPPRGAASVARGDRRAGSSTTSADAARTGGSSRRSRTPRRREPRHERIRRNRPAPLLPAHGRRHRGVRQPRALGALRPAAPALYPEDINAYLLIGADGRVKVFSGKIEMGQGVMTSQAQMAAEELGVAVESIDMVLGDTERCPWDMGTFGSMTTRFFGPALRAAAAEARLVLRSWRPRSSACPAASSSRRESSRCRQSRAQDNLRRALAGKTDRACRGQESRDASGVAIPGNGNARRSGSTRSKRSPAARSTRPTSGSPGCSTRASCGLRRTARRCRRVDMSAAAKPPGVTVVKQDDLVAVLHSDPEAAEKALERVKADGTCRRPRSTPKGSSITS